MAVNKAYRLVVTLEAGTAKFFTDMKAAGVVVKEFEKKAGAFGEPAISEAKATSSAMKALEGGFLNNSRAADGFLEKVLHLGPVLQAAFPVIGAVAFAGAAVEAGKKIVEFFKNVAEAPKRIAMAFGEMAAATRSSNDELAVSNQRLQNEIDKLEGRHENTLALLLLEARSQADKLADSLDKDLKALQAVLKQEDSDFMAGLFATAGTGDIKKQIDKFCETISGITEAGVDKVAAASTKGPGAQKMQAAAQAEMNTNLQAAYADQIAKLQGLLREARTAAKGVVENVTDIRTGAQMPITVRKNEDARIAALMGTIRVLEGERDSVGLQAAAGALGAKKEGLGDAGGDAESRHPFENRMAELNAQIDATKAKLEAAGRGQAGEIIAKAFGDAAKAIAETNKSLGYLGASLTDVGKAKIESAELAIATGEAEAEWREKLAASTASIDDRIRAQDLLTAAIGKGAEATRAAAVEARLMAELGQHYGDAAWMAVPEHQQQVAGLRSGYGREVDSQRAEASGESLLKLSEEIRLEGDLARAQALGAEAVRQATLAAKLRTMQLTLSASAFKEQAAAEIELYNAQRETAAAADVAKIEEKIEATRRLTVAVRGGAAAVREATLANELARISREGDTSLPGMLFGARAVAAVGEDAASHGQAVAEAAAHVDKVRIIDDEIAKLTEARKTLTDTLPVDIALLDLENQRLKVLVDQSLAMGKAQDGVRAFFIEMQEQAKRASDMIYDALNSSIDKSSENLAKLLTGQKTAWAPAFKSIGESMVQSTVKSAMQRELGALGIALDPKAKAAAAAKKAAGIGKPDGTLANFFWAKLVDGGSGMGPALATPVPAGAGATATGNLVKQGASSAPGIFGAIAGVVGPVLGALLGKPGTPAVSSKVTGYGGVVPTNTLDPSTSTYGGQMAGGGGVEAGVAYKINESEGEYYIPGRAGTIVPHPGTGGGDIHVHNHIDARGADLGAYNRIARGMEMTGKASASAAVKAMHEHARRVPARA